MQLPYHRVPSPNLWGSALRASSLGWFTDIDFHRYRSVIQEEFWDSKLRGASVWHCKLTSQNDLTQNPALFLANQSYYLCC